MSWETVELGKVTSKIGSGITPRGGASVYISEGTALIRSQNILDLGFSESGLAYISDEHAASMKSHCVIPGDVLLNITGDSTGRVVMWDRQCPAVVNQHVSIIRPKAKQVNSRWLQYFLVQESTKRYLLTLAASGGSRPALTKGMLSALQIPLPPLSQQDAIAGVLGALDDKIAANLAAIAKTDELRLALWKSALTRGEVERPLSSIAQFINGRAFTKGATGTGRVVIRIAELNSGIGASTIRNDIEVQDKYLARPGDLLFSWSGSLGVYRWKYDEGIVNQHIFKVIPNPGISLWALECALQQQIVVFKGIAEGKATTMGHIKRADLDLPVSIPQTIQEEEQTLGNTCWNYCTALEKENRVLARTRDELLPLLMNGKISVTEASEAVEGAVGKQAEGDGDV